MIGNHNAGSSVFDGNVRVVRSPVRLSKTPARKPTPSPVHGQHTREVLKEVLGLPDGEVDRLAAAGVVGLPRGPLKGGA